MKKFSLAVLFGVITLVAFSSLAFASSGTDQREATSPAVTTAVSPVDLSDEEILAAASPIGVTLQGAPAVATSVASAATEAEAPEAPEGNTPDAPGGPDHQFEGEETGNH